VPELRLDQRLLVRARRAGQRAPAPAAFG